MGLEGIVLKRIDRPCWNLAPRTRVVFDLTLEQSATGSGDARVRAEQDAPRASFCGLYKKQRPSTGRPLPAAMTPRLRLRLHEFAIDLLDLRKAVLSVAGFFENNWNISSQLSSAALATDEQWRAIWTNNWAS
jgi:hypothetical protein